MAKMSGLWKLISGLCLVAAPAFGYEFNKTHSGTPMKWDKPVLECGVDPSLGKEYKDAFFECANKWSAALDGKLKFVESMSGNYDIYFTRGKINDTWDAQAYWGEDGKGNLRLSVITLNENKRFSRNINEPDGNVKNLDGIILHELGHSLGMGDLNSKNIEKITDPYILYWDMPTMFNEYSFTPSHSILHVDDIKGIRMLYGLPAPVVEALPFEIEKVISKKRHKNIDLYKRLSRGWYEFSSPVGGSLAIFNIDGDVFPGNPVQWKLPRGYHTAEVYFRGRTATRSFLIGREPKKVRGRGANSPDFDF